MSDSVVSENLLKPAIAAAAVVISALVLFLTGSTRADGPSGTAAEEVGSACGDRMSARSCIATCQDAFQLGGPRSRCLEAAIIAAHGRGEAL